MKANITKHENQYINLRTGGMLSSRRDCVKGLVGLAGILATGQAPAAFVRSMLGARGMAFGGGKNKPSIPYTKDGLVFIADALLSDSFTNLSDSGVVSTVIGGSFNHNVDEFVGNDATVSFSNIDLSPFNNKEFTIDVVIRSGRQESINGNVSLLDYNSSDYVYLFQNTLQLNRIYLAYIMSYYNFTGESTYASLTFVNTYLPAVSNYVVRLYVNGERKVSSVFNKQQPVVSSVSFGLYRPCNKRICSYRIYNRAKTVEEISSDSETDVNRFSLPS